MNYGYGRCSTNELKQDVERQIRELMQLGIDRKCIFFEYASGLKEDRTEFNKMLEKIVEGDAIVTTEVSRITRSTKQLCNVIEFAKSKKIKLVLGNFEVDCTQELNPMTEGMLKMMGVFAELERNIISERVKSGIQNARAKGKKLGRPALTVDDIPAIFYKHYPKYKNGEMNKAEFARISGISYPTIYKYLALVENDKERKGNYGSRNRF